MQPEQFELADAQPGSVKYYRRFYSSIGITGLRDFATLLEACQFPSRFSELERKTGWYAWKLRRILNTLISLGLVHIVYSGKRKSHKAYEVTPCGIEALKTLEAKLTGLSDYAYPSNRLTR